MHICRKAGQRLRQQSPPNRYRDRVDYGGAAVTKYRGRHHDGDHGTAADRRRNKKRTVSCSTGELTQAGRKCTVGEVLEESRRDEAAGGNRGPLSLGSTHTAQEDEVELLWQKS